MRRHACDLPRNGRELLLAFRLPAPKIALGDTLSVNNDTPMSHNPHMSFSTTFVGSLCGTQVECGGGNGTSWGAFVPDYNIVITRITATLNDAIDSTCLPAGINVFDVSTFQVLGSVSLPANVYLFNSGSISIAAPAGDFISVYPWVTFQNCHLVPRPVAMST